MLPAGRGRPACRQCGGSGRVTKVVKAAGKEGGKEVKREVICLPCNGTGRGGYLTK